MTNEIYGKFPTLEALAIDAEEQYNELTQQQKELRNNSRYDDNESERAYLLDELAAEKDEALADIEEQYQSEIELIEADIQKRAFSIPEATDDEKAAASELITSIDMQINASSNVIDTVDLLVGKASIMTDYEKMQLASNIASIEQAASSKAVNNDEKEELAKLFSDIKTELADIPAVKMAEQQKRDLRELRTNTNDTIRGYYDSLDHTMERLQQGGRK